MHTHTHRFFFMIYWPIGILSGATWGRRKSEWIKIQNFFCFGYYFIQINCLFSMVYIMSIEKKYSWSLLIKRKIWGPFLYSTCEEITCGLWDNLIPLLKLIYFKNVNYLISLSETWALLKIKSKRKIWIVSFSF